MSGGLILLIALGVLVLWFIGTYNTLVRRRNEVKNAWAQIDVQLKRRYDLIPNLIETARGYMKHERETLETIARARSGAVAAKGAAAAGQAEAQVVQALRGFYAVAENYPDLKANQNFLALQEELASTENKIGFARQFYNDTVLKLNTAIESIPTNIVAGIGKFEKAEFFELESPEERKVPKVQF
jgi:LemA protein